jgi:hypothetical protein
VRVDVGKPDAKREIARKRLADRKIEADAATAARDAAFWAAKTAELSFSPSEFPLPTPAENIFVHAVTTSPEAEEAERDWQTKHFDEIVAGSSRLFWSTWPSFGEVVKLEAAQAPPRTNRRA